MQNSNRVILIGWDAADWKIINQLMDEGRMPTVKRLVENGVSGNMRTLSPPLSPMLWTSIATGKRPFKHGIYGFIEPAPDGKSVRPMTNLSRKCKAIWNILNQQDKRSIVVGWWPSHPAEPINGVMVSDFFNKAPKKPSDPWTMLASSVHPRELAATMAELRLHPSELLPEHVLPFVPDGAEIDQTTDPRLSMLMKVICECQMVHNGATHLLETELWDFAAIYYDAIDHFCHGFMKYHPPKQESISEFDFRMFKHVVSTAYVYHDMMLARLLELAGDDCRVLLISDHGFHPDHLRPTVMPSEPAGPAAEHRDYGIFVAHGPGIKKDQLIHGVTLLDIAPTLLAMYGLPVGDDMDGRPLLEIFESEPSLQTIPSWEDVPGHDGRHSNKHPVDAAESKAALDQLVALGYVEPLDDDVQLTIRRTQRELDYNLARSYMDAGMHVCAIPLLEQLYLDFPLDFRFGVQLANCLRVTSRTRDLKRVVENLESQWRVASQEARKRMANVAQVARERKKNWLEMKKVDDQNAEREGNIMRLARVGPNGKPVLFDEAENHEMRRLRAIARGNPQTLDFLAASVAHAEGDHERALELLEKAEITEARSASFQYHVGNVYLALNRLEDAQRAFATGLEIDEYDPNCMLGLCRTSLEQGRRQQALEFGRRAIGLRYHFPVAHYFLAEAKRRDRDFDGAVDSLHVALKQNPNFAEAHHLLAKIHSTSIIDDVLAEKHKLAVEQLAAENDEIADEDNSICVPELDREEIEKNLPDVFRNKIHGDEFLPCLAQPRVVFARDKHSGSGGEQNGSGVEPVIIVSGLPRSGTSLMMQMLAAAGLKVYSDHNRVADESNPKGYFEADVVKQLARKNIWIQDCHGQVVKVVAPLIPYLPQAGRYQVVFMQRDLDEIVNSQTSMLQRLEKKGADIEKRALAEVYRQHVVFALNLLQLYQHPVLRLEYASVVSNPQQVANQLAHFLAADLDLDAMAAVVDPSLYREKSDPAFAAPLRS